MPQQVRKRSQKTIEFNANGREREELSRGMVYRELYLRLSGQLTLASANNTAALTSKGDAWACVDEIKIVANNTDVIKSIHGPDLWWLNMFWFGVLPPVDEALGDGSTTNPSFDSTLILPFWFPLGTRPIDTALDARELSDLKIEISWNSASTINTNASFNTDPTIEVASLESFNVEGPFAQWRLSFIEKDISATNSQFQINLPVGSMYPAFMLNTTDDNSAGGNTTEDVGNVLNNFKWVSGTTVFADLPEEILEASYWVQQAMPRPWGGAAYNDARMGNDNNWDGYYMYNHVTDGFLSEAVDTLGFSEHNLELDVTTQSGTTKVRVYPHEIVPVRSAGQNNG